MHHFSLHLLGKQLREYSSSLQCPYYRCLKLAKKTPFIPFIPLVGPKRLVFTELCTDIILALVRALSLKTVSLVIATDSSRNYSAAADGKDFSFSNLQIRRVFIPSELLYPILRVTKAVSWVQVHIC